MAQTRSLPRTRETTTLELRDMLQQREQVFRYLGNQLKPWLFEFGNWVFGGLLALHLFVITALLTVGPDHPAVPIALALLTCALPLAVAGIVALRVLKDVDRVALDDVVKQAFRQAGVPAPEEAPDSPETRAGEKRRRARMSYPFWLAVVSALLTILGMTAALAYMGWWVAGLFVLACLVSTGVIVSILGGVMEGFSPKRS